jgi:hypothetical protein
MRTIVLSILLAAVLAGCSALGDTPSSTAADVGPDSVNCANQAHYRDGGGSGSIDCGDF